jgi:hypothetical protein
MKLTDEQKQKICDYLQKSLQSATLIEGGDEDLKLVDHLSFSGETIKEGIEMIENIVEQIYFDMDDWEL